MRAACSVIWSWASGCCPSAAACSTTGAGWLCCTACSATTAPPRVIPLLAVSPARRQLVGHPSLMLQPAQLLHLPVGEAEQPAAGVDQRSRDQRAAGGLELVPYPVRERAVGLLPLL